MMVGSGCAKICAISEIRAISVAQTQVSKARPHGMLGRGGAPIVVCHASSFEVTRFYLWTQRYRCGFGWFYSRENADQPVGGTQPAAREFHREGYRCTIQVSMRALGRAQRIDRLRGVYEAAPPESLAGGTTSPAYRGSSPYSALENRLPGAVYWSSAQ
jgi:hypothetical protein